MNVLINMKMPECCAECDVEGHYENSNGDEYGFFCPFGYKAYTEKTRDAKRLDNCPLIPVPEHGRLIDVDSLIESLSILLEHSSNLVNGQWFVNTIREQPTVIPDDPAEGDE